jgi:predicted porin
MGLFGAEYSLHKRFSVFGEVGFGYTTSSSKSKSSPPSPIDDLIAGGSAHGWSTRTGAGVIFYF